MDAIVSVNNIAVYFRDRLVGRLGMNEDNRLCTFEYDKAWLEDGFSLSPLELPLQQGMFIAKAEPFYGNFGIFEDSLPDGYGRYLLNRMLAQRGIDEFGLSPLQRLGIVGASGMGALRYVPELLPEQVCSLPEWNTLQQIALDVLAEKTSDHIDMLYFNSGNSGGCRPKCILHDKDGDWIVKFRHMYDPADMGIQEFRCNQLAQQCGVEVAEYKLIENTYFASRRFDRDEKGVPLHVATAAALLQENINPPKTDYKVLLALTGYMTQSPAEVERMFRLMVFNVLIGNKDDHAKNFTFIHKGNKWSLGPAYDLTRSEGYHGEHATSVMGHGCPTEEDMLAAAQSIRIVPARARTIIAEVKAGLQKV